MVMQGYACPRWKYEDADRIQILPLGHVQVADAARHFATLPRRYQFMNGNNFHLVIDSNRAHPWFGRSFQAQSDLGIELIQRFQDWMELPSQRSRIDRGQILELLSQ